MAGGVDKGMGDVSVCLVWVFWSGNSMGVFYMGRGGGLSYKSWQKLVFWRGKTIDGGGSRGDGDDRRVLGWFIPCGMWLGSLSLAGDHTKWRAGGGYVDLTMANTIESG